ncbi:MAG TPA: cadherin-like beta sandwich domain-containing protein [Candidatus Acidoferrum sp.]|nr:cadherin-like beta sandwich domain-containing protein [Candidatus Acidoferrum sp.]
MNAYTRPPTIVKLGHQLLAGMLLLIAAAAVAGDNRAKLFPILEQKQVLTYLIRFQSAKNVKTESTVATPMAPNNAQMDARGLLQIEVLDAQPLGGKQVLQARGQFLSLDFPVSAKEPREKQSGGDAQRMDPAGKTIEFTISLDGLIQNSKGLENLSLEQQQAWQEWVSRFAMGWTIPAAGVKQGEKWKSEQPEQASAPIAGLNWTTESTYVRDESCHATQLSGAGELSTASVPTEICAVILTTATLKQKSSQKDATPEDFKLHELRTAGTAKGKNEVITYISLKSGLVVRATEQANQFMDVVVMTADGSNRVHYNVDATSHSEVLLITQTPLNHP